MDQPLLFLVENGEEDGLVAEPVQLNGFLDDSSLALTVSHVPRVGIRNQFRQLIFVTFLFRLVLLPFGFDFSLHINI